MKTFTGLLTLALLAITGAQAQFSDLPQCGSSCAQLSTSKATACTSSDIKCLCSSEDYVNAMYDCLAGACTFGDQSSTIGRMNEICAAAASTPDASSTPPATSSTAASSSSAAAGAPSSTAAAPAPTSSAPAVVFTRTAGALTETPSSGTGTTTSGAGTRSPGTTTVPPGAATTPSQSTTVVVRTVGGEETGSAGGGNILDGNGASGVRASGVVAGIAGVLAVVALL